MTNPAHHIEQVLQELGMSGQELKDAQLAILSVRKELTIQLLELDQRKLPRQLAIANSLRAVQVVDEITDQIAVIQGLLREVMQVPKQKDKDGEKQESIYDKMAIIKAKIESLVVEGEIQARTLNSITQHLKAIKMSEINDPDKPPIQG